MYQQLGFEKRNLVFLINFLWRGGANNNNQGFFRPSPGVPEKLISNPKHLSTQGRRKEDPDTKMVWEIIWKFFSKKSTSDFSKFPYLWLFDFHSNKSQVPHSEYLCNQLCIIFSLLRKFPVKFLRIVAMNFIFSKRGNFKNQAFYNMAYSVIACFCLPVYSSNEKVDSRLSNFVRNSYFNHYFNFIFN